MRACGSNRQELAHAGPVGARKLDPALRPQPERAIAQIAHWLLLALDYDRNPFAPRFDPLKAILAKLKPLTLWPMLPPPLKTGMEPSHEQRKGRRRTPITVR